MNEDSQIEIITQRVPHSKALILFLRGGHRTYIFPFCGTEAIFCPCFVLKFTVPAFNQNCLCYFLNLGSRFKHLWRLVSRDWLQFRVISKEVLIYTGTYACTCTQITQHDCLCVLDYSQPLEMWLFLSVIFALLSDII